MTTQSTISKILLAALAAAAIGATFYQPGEDESLGRASLGIESTPPWLTQEGRMALDSAGAGELASTHVGHAGHDPHAGLGIAPAYPENAGALPGRGQTVGAPAVHETDGPHEGNPHGHAQWTTALPAKQSVACQRSAEENGYTVLELHEQRAELGDTKVVVRATVTKVTTGIRGANYVHLRDGSGSAEAGTNDLTVETQQVPTVGQVVEWEGQLALDQDLGWGYHYAVLLRGAERLEPSGRLAKIPSGRM